MNIVNSSLSCCRGTFAGLILLLTSITMTMACVVESEDDDADQYVGIWLDEWRDDLPPGISLIVKGGQLINKSFPAVSADRSRIALLYYAGPPMAEGYPTLDIYSTKSLALQERMELFPEHQQLIKSRGVDPDLLDPNVLEGIQRRLTEVNRILSCGAYTAMDMLFELPKYGPLDGVENLGKRIDYPRTQDLPRLSISSLSTGRVELEMMMSSEFPSYGVAPESACGEGAEPEQAWIDTELQILVLRVVTSRSQDGCDLPEQWFLKRLGDL